MMKLMYRPHRGGFDEAMAEKQEFVNMDALLEATGGNNAEWYSFDERLGVDCFVILTEDGQPRGFCWYEP